MCVSWGGGASNLCSVQPWRTVHQEAGAFLLYQIPRWEFSCEAHDTKDFEMIFKLQKLQKRHFSYSIVCTTLESLEFGAISPQELMLILGLAGARAAYQL